jgi:hypothetical protein
MLKIISSFNNTINEFNNLKKYLLNINIKTQIYDHNYKFNDYLISYLSFVLLFFLILYLFDNIKTHWNNIFHKSNKYNTKKYNNIFFLFLYETTKYITQIPNLITLIIGIIQAIYAFKFINIIVTLFCWIFAIMNEFTKYLTAKKSDELINSYIVKTHDNINIRSDKIKINDEIILEHNTKTPSFIKVINIKHNNINKNLSHEQLEDFNVGFYDDKESTGEEISKPFYMDDIIPPHRIISRPDIKINCKIIKYVDPIIFEHQVTIPNYLNNVRFIIDLYAVILLIFISLFISASATQFSEYNLTIIFKHIIATTIAGNVLIPSMRMTLLYNIYSLLLSLSFNNIKINSYDSFSNLDDVKSVIFDKTGTITEENLMIHEHYLFDNHPLIKKLNKKGWSNDEIAFAVTMANSESNIHNINDAWGTSPEENKILEYWINIKKVNLIFNPVKSSGEVIFNFPNGKERKIIIKLRQPYNFDLGKISVIIFNDSNIENNIELIIRQHGTSQILNNFSPDKILYPNQSNKKTSFDWAYQICINDKKRSMSIAINNDDDEFIKWDILSIYTFDNPLRIKIPSVINFFRNKHISCSILTGDSKETAEDIAKKCGFPSDIFTIQNENNISEALNMAHKHKITVSIEGILLNMILNNTDNLAELLLNNNNIFKIIYKASKNIKENIVTHTNNCLYVGDAKNDEFAIKKAYIGVCLTHGAETSKLYADICIKHPIDLIDLMTQNGYKDMLLTGGQKIFKDVCFMGGLICGCLMVGIHLHKFEFINHSLLYKDVWNPAPMLMISSIQYTTSVIGYASSNCNPNDKLSSFLLGIIAIINNLMGLIIGITISWVIKNYLFMFNFDHTILHMINVIILIKHSLHCINNKTNFGNQVISNSNKFIGFAMNIIDSISVRILLYILYCIIF